MNTLQDELTVPIGPPGDAVPVPLRSGGLGRTVLITGGKGTGKTVLARQIVDRCQPVKESVLLHEPIITGAWSRTPRVEQFVDADDMLAHLQAAVYGQHPMPEAVLFDDLSALAARPRQWSQVLRQAARVGVATIAVTSTLRPTLFGREGPLRSHLLGGSLVQFFIADRWDRDHESVVDLPALPRCGVAWMQTPALDTPRQVRFEAQQ